MLETHDHPAGDGRPSESPAGTIRELRLARPPVNALTPELLGALRRAVEEAPEQGALALVLSGRPGMFTAGLDVPHLLGLDRSGIESNMTELFGLMQALACSPVPTLGAITGHSPAGGAVIALFCDRLVMAEGGEGATFRIGLNEVEVGLGVPPVLYNAMARRVGRHRATDLLTRGRLVDTAEAHRIGLVDETAPVDEVVERGLDWCREVIARPRRAVAYTREVARADLRSGFEGLEAQLGDFVAAWFSDETQAAMKALVARLAARG